MLLANINPNVVTYTTLLRGFCEVARIDDAKSLFVTMLEGSTDHDLVMHTPPPPNVRSLNAVLRGCLRVGAVPAARELCHAASTSTNRIAFDETSYEYMILLLCQAMRVVEAEQLTAAFIMDYSCPLPVLVSLPVTSTGAASGRASCGDTALSTLADREIRPDAMLQAAAIFLCMARTYTLCNNFTASAAYLRATREALEACRSSAVRRAMLLRLENSSGSEGGFKKGQASGSGSTSGGSGAGHAGGASSSSIGLFMQHRNAELSRECTWVEQYNSRWSATTASNDSSHSDDSGQCRNENILSIMSKTLLFFSRPPPPVHGYPDDGQHTEVLTNMLSTLDESFGLSRLPAAAAKSCKGSVMAAIVRTMMCDADGTFISFPMMFKGGAGGGGVVGGGGGLAMTRGKRKRGGDRGGAVAHKRPSSARGEQQYVDKEMDEGHSISFDGSSGKLEQHGGEEGEVEVRMEICSGSGDWIVEQARAYAETNKAGKSKSNPNVLYVALELRADRVHHTMYQAVLRDATHNVAVIGGDAAQILPEFIRPSTVSVIYINHPEPPERRSGGEDMSQGSHLLTGVYVTLQPVHVLDMDR